MTRYGADRPGDCATWRAALERLGLGLADVVRTPVYVTDIARWEEYGRAHGAAFGDTMPATSMIGVSALIDPRMLVEVEAVAYRRRGRRLMGVAVRVIPCLDVDAGRVVKGVNFRDLRDAGDPVELAAAYDAEGADELVFLDITASSGGRDTMIDVVQRTADQVFIPLTVGGGVRSVDDMDRLLRAGADKVSLNTAAIARPDLLAEAARRFGAQCVVLSVDARRRPERASFEVTTFEVTTHGGRRGTGIDAVEWARARRGTRGRRDPAQLDGRGRHQGRIRPRADPGRARGGGRAHHRQRRGR